MKKVISLSRSGASGVARQVAGVVADTLKRLFVAAGAEYNTLTGSFSLNGVDDITEEQMLLIYDSKNLMSASNMRAAAVGDSVPTYYPMRGMVGRRREGCPVDLSDAFCGSSVEVVKFGQEQSLNSADSENLLPISALDGAFEGCTKIHTIYPMSVCDVKSISGETFRGCCALRELRLKGLAASLDVSSSPLLSYNTLNYIVCYAAPENVITLKLHPYTYNYIKGQQQPPSSVGGSDSGWETLAQIAELKGIILVANDFAVTVSGAVLLLESVAVQGVLLDLSDTTALVEATMLVLV